MPSVKVTSFTISSKENKFITVGCDSYGYLNSNFKGATYSQILHYLRKIVAIPLMQNKDPIIFL